MEYIIKQFRGYPCELDMSKMHVTRSSYGIISPKDSPYINIFRQTIKKHRSAGLYNQLFEHHRQKYNTDVADKCPELDSNVAFREVGFLTISSAFLFLCGGVLAALLWLVVEKGIAIRSCSIKPICAPSTHDNLIRKSKAIRAQTYLYQKRYAR